MHTFTLSTGSLEFTFGWEAFPDDGMAPIWKEHDGHGVVSDWTTREKAPGERVLHTDGKSHLLYDVQASQAKALAQGWDAVPYNTDGRETPRQQAAKAVAADFDNLQKWCDGSRYFCVLRVVVLETDGTESEIDTYLGGVEAGDDMDDYLIEHAKEMGSELLLDLGKTWGTVTTTKFALL